MVLDSMSQYFLNACVCEKDVGKDRFCNPNIIHGEILALGMSDEDVKWF